MSVLGPSLKQTCGISRQWANTQESRPPRP